MSRLGLFAVLVSAAAHASFINYSSREINVKIVYYGAETAGLAENLEYVYAKTSPEAKGKLISLATETDRTLFFDFVPPGLGEIRGFKTRFHLYTVPGKVSYDASRKLILKGVDGIVFVWDADPTQLVPNLESWRGLRANLAEQGYDWQKVPLVVQIDTRRHKGAVPTDTIKRDLGLGTQPVFITEPTTGVGVFDSLKGIAKLVLLELKKGASEEAPAPGGRLAPPAGTTGAPKPPPPPNKPEGCGIYLAAPDGGCVADRAKAVAAIKASSLAKHAATLEKQLAPVVWLEPKRPSKSGLVPGQSHLAGLPHLPTGVKWPRYKDKPLELVAQVKLADLPPGPLPKTGWLTAFCPVSDPEWVGEPGDGACRVLYFDGSVQPREPEGRAPTDTERKSIPLQLSAGLTLPDYEQSQLELKDDDLDAHFALIDTITQGRGFGHRVLGASADVQGDPRLECAVAFDRVTYETVKPAVLEQWVLLMQIDSDEDAGWMFGDVGCLYFFVKKKDLAAKKFDQVCALVQSN